MIKYIKSVFKFIKSNKLAFSLIYLIGIGLGVLAYWLWKEGYEALIMAFLIVFAFIHAKMMPMFHLK